MATEAPRQAFAREVEIPGEAESYDDADMPSEAEPPGDVTETISELSTSQESA